MQFRKYSYSFMTAWYWEKHLWIEGDLQCDLNCPPPMVMILATTTWLEGIGDCSEQASPPPSKRLVKGIARWLPRQVWWTKDTRWAMPSRVSPSRATIYSAPKTGGTVARIGTQGTNGLSRSAKVNCCTRSISHFVSSLSSLTMFKAKRSVITSGYATVCQLKRA